MKLKSWRTATLSIALLALLSEHSTSVSNLRAQEANRPEQQHVIRRSMDRRFSWPTARFVTVKLPMDAGLWRRF